MFCYIISCAESWVFYQDQSMKILGCKKDKYQRIIRELKAAGYLISHVKQAERGRLNGTEWEIIDNPKAQDAGEHTENKTQDAVDSGVVSPSDREPEKPASGDREPEKPDCRLNPTAGKTSHIRNQTKQKEKLTSCAADAAHTKIGFSETGEVADAFDEFWEAHPRPVQQVKTREAFYAAIGAGADARSIISGARAYADEQSGNDPKFVKTSALWLTDKRWADHKPKRSSGKDGSREGTARLWADIILTDGYVPDNAINTGMRADIIALGLMTDQQLSERGFA